MTHGYGPPPQGRPDDDPRSRRRPGAERPGAEPPTGGFGGGRRVPQPPPPARNLGGTTRVPPPGPMPGRPPQGGPPTGGYPAYPPTPTSPGMGRSGPPTGAMPRPGSQTGRVPLVPPPGRDRTPPPKNKPAAGRGRSKGKKTAPPRRPGLPDLPHVKGVSLREMPQYLLKQHRNWMVGIGVIAALVVGAVCGLGSWMLLRKDTLPPGLEAVPQASVVLRDISSRDVDPNPLSADNVFPTTEIVADPSVPAYVRLGGVGVTADCSLAAPSAVGRYLVGTAGCSQVIRATFASSDGDFLVTAGVFNLANETAANDAVAAIEGLITAGDGRLAGYVSDDRDNTKVIFDAPARPLLMVRGHFLLYLVVAHKDGSDFVDGDSTGVEIIRYDLLSKYLRDTVIVNWSIDQAATAALQASEDSASADAASDDADASPAG